MASQEDILFGKLAKNGGTVYVTVEDDQLKMDIESAEDQKKAVTVRDR